MASWQMGVYFLIPWLGGDRLSCFGQWMLASVIQAKAWNRLTWLTCFFVFLPLTMKSTSFGRTTGQRGWETQGVHQDPSWLYFSKLARGKRRVISQRNNPRIIADLSPEIMQAKRWWVNIFEVLRGRNLEFCAPWKYFGKTKMRWLFVHTYKSKRNSLPSDPHYN